MKTEQEYQIELANHGNFYLKQMEVAYRLERVILDSFYDTYLDNDDFDIIVKEEVKKEIESLKEKEAMNRPNKPNYHRANND